MSASRLGEGGNKTPPPRAHGHRIPLNSRPSYETHTHPPRSPHLCKSGCLGRSPLVELRSRWLSVALELERKETVVTAVVQLIQGETPPLLFHHLRGKRR